MITINILIHVIAAMSVFVFILFAFDKLFAKMDTWRIPEAVLLWFSFFGGAAGALAAMSLFNHKTDKKWFTKTIPFMLMLHITLLVVFIYI
ncbi:MAG: DUF1294 domain-containing protein [Bacteroidaceae bacterium]|nr:DUF1294 domain-containing protein [Bacteroidaceae bacterium]MBR3906984.1 DUF1294 domain-containing protein [Bacteroidaceae bacterium]